MKVLVACEESHAVTKELRNLGHEAYEYFKECVNYNKDDCCNLRK